ncbi:MAG TPA: NAD(P)/FAD-dependent oxidoreductase [Acetobacteraceae bacterium]|nr:NAD(P)/FAD-dependent oxidoreductase [Acetobacteraceae bacterium]
MTDAAFDVAVIGGGVVGCAVLRGFALAGARAVLLERDGDLLAGASKGNSGLLHTGFDAEPGSLEAECVREGQREYRAIRGRLNLPLLQSGAIVVAWTADELAALPAILARARENGVPDAAPLSREAVLAREPHLSPALLGGVWVPDEAIIDPWSAPLAYAMQAIANGAEIRRRAEVRGGRLEGGVWQLDTAAGPVSARVAVNCAGNYGDLVEAIARNSPFRIRPRKGQFVVFDKTAHRLLSAIVVPVPSARTKGVVLARTAFGNLLVGPTAEYQEDRSLATIEQPALERLVAHGRRILPALAEHPVTAAFAGLRPATERKDYCIEAVPDRRWISVAGIRSTGLSGALGIARHVRALHEVHFGALRDLADPVWPRVPNLAEHAARAYQEAGRSAIVCHCELVTQAEIATALDGPLGAATLGGLRRRTRCMLGRCQGFYCSRRIIELADGRLPGLLAA